MISGWGQGRSGGIKWFLSNILKFSFKLFGLHEFVVRGGEGGGLGC